MECIAIGIVNDGQFMKYKFVQFLVNSGCIHSFVVT